MKKIIIFLLLILNFLNADISQYFPKLEGRVIDEANLLSPEVKKDINNILKNEENKSSNQIVVVILNSLNGYSIEEFSYQLGRFWGIGQKDKNNGVLLVVSMKEREIRIEVGYGLEGALTDKISHEIISYTIKPNFKASQYELGILKAVNEIIKATQGEYVAKPKNKEYNQNNIKVVYLGIIFILAFFNFITKIIKHKFLYKLSSALIFTFAFTAFLPLLQDIFINSVIIGFFIVIFLITYFMTNTNFDEMDIHKFQKDIKEKGFDINSLNSKDLFNSSNNYFGRSGGFSGRGGSFGGGGASGRW
ncbi:TPM domain-containing protein [Aliarcobacter butzleri]|uniref:TPM domain-containing protein n=1 Tax=Aliarcobacter butzleri TaxID=28197 RepID=UPI0021B2F359|nr:TPM domain-containing protein [Aliarcobacter butzleri]MCT7568262.1 TPM domain-containing protein [Aliarcobacter butzleri]